MPIDLRTALEEAYAKAEGDADEPGKPENPDNDSEAEAKAASPAEPVSEGTGEEGDGKPEEEEEESGTGEPESTESETPVIAAPVAWKGAAKQHWNELPVEVQEEVSRREKETSQVLRDTSEARDFQQKFKETVEPYRALITAQGVDELQATRNLMQTAAVLQMGNPHQKAGVVAQIINAYGIDLPTLGTFFGAGAEEGEVQPGNNGGLDPRLAQYLDEKLAPVNQFMGNIQQNMQNRAQQRNASVDAEIETFAADPANIFFEDVRDTMSTLFSVAAQQGRELSMKEAYDMAVSMDPKLKVIQDQRQAALQAQKGGVALQKKKMAAKSIQGVPQQAPTEAPTDLRGQLEASWNRLESGH